MATKTEDELSRLRDEFVEKWNDIWRKNGSVREAAALVENPKYQVVVDDDDFFDDTEGLLEGTNTSGRANNR